jgi:hydroxypyruvate isomerase
MTLRGQPGPDADTLKPHGIRLRIEPLNTCDSLGYFLTIMVQARQIIERVGSESVPPKGPLP